MAVCVAVTCVAGEVHPPVRAYLRERYEADSVDLVTEPGAVHTLARRLVPQRVNFILDRIDFCLEHHPVVALAVVAHHGCPGNPVPDDRQVSMLAQAVRLLRREYMNMDILGLWVDTDGVVHDATTPGDVDDGLLR